MPPHGLPKNGAMPRNFMQTMKKAASILGARLLRLCSGLPNPFPLFSTERSDYISNFGRWSNFEGC
jgi:hypothetical protein